MTSASPRSILVFSGRYHIISTASIVNNCIMRCDKISVNILILSYYIVNFKTGLCYSFSGIN